MTLSNTGHMRINKPDGGKTLQTATLDLSDVVEDFDATLKSFSKPTKTYNHKNQSDKGELQCSKCAHYFYRNKYTNEYIVVVVVIVSKKQH